MKTRLAPWSIPVLSLILVLGCTAQRNDDAVAAPPPDTETSGALTTGADTELMTKLSNEVYVLVETVGDTFKVTPDPVFAYPKQRVIWVADEDDVIIEITFRPEKGKDTPGVEPPAKPCSGKAKKCGGNPIGGKSGQFYYSVTGDKNGKPLKELDPVLEILP